MASRAPVCTAAKTLNAQFPSALPNADTDCGIRDRTRTLRSHIRRRVILDGLLQAPPLCQRIPDCVVYIALRAQEHFKVNGRRLTLLRIEIKIFER